MYLIQTHISPPMLSLNYQNQTRTFHSESLPCGIYLEPIVQVYLLGHVALLARNNGQRTIVDGESQKSHTRDFPYLKLGAHLWPHASSEDLPPAVGGSALEIINDEAK